ncbi:MAG TPA: hypothetical protein VFG69_13970 [Nannocystaceae bacterium]|nr:hypothetical protein [Nannocystaceae bacterium]
MSITFGSPTAWVAALTILAACRPGEGQRCVCAGECRRGLVCAQNGRVLDDKECLPADERSPGVCIDEAQADEAGDGELKEDLTIRHDLGGKRDFEPGTPTADEDGSSDAATTNATSTGATTSTGGSSSTGATDSSTSSGSSDTTNSTGGSTGS